MLRSSARQKAPLCMSAMTQRQETCRLAQGRIEDETGIKAPRVGQPSLLHDRPWGYEPN